MKELEDAFDDYIRPAEIEPWQRDLIKMMEDFDAKLRAVMTYPLLTERDFPSYDQVFFANGFYRGGIGPTRNKEAPITSNMAKRD